MTIERQGSGEIIIRIPPSERPYDVQPKELYSVDQLMSGSGSSQGSLDERIEAYYKKAGQQVPKQPEEALCQRIHDDHIDRHVLAFVEGRGTPDHKPRKIVGIMGGHVQDRTSRYYAMVAQIGYMLTKAGYCVLTGGGPGVMEAGNLGAYMGAYPAEQLDRAISMLTQAPNYPPLDPSDPENRKKREAYVKTALSVRQQFPNGSQSLGVPTWAYPDEPTGQFASHIAKYLANSIREDGLLAIAAYGVIFGPGAAGTSQEIFQDAAHNSYWSFGSRGPMVFLGTDGYRRSPSLYDVVLAAANRDGYSDSLALLDDAGSALAFIEKHPPVYTPGAERTVGRSEYAYPVS